MKLYEANDGRIWLVPGDGKSKMIDCSHQAVDHPDCMATECETYGTEWDDTDCEESLVCREDITGMTLAAEWDGNEMHVYPSAGPLARRYAMGG